MGQRIRIAVVLGALLVALAACGGGEEAATQAPATTVGPAATQAPTATAAPTETEPPATETGALPGTVTTGEATPFRATLVAPTHAPVVNTRWRYRVTVTDEEGEPLAATVTVEVVDPLQQPHPVDYDGTTEPIVDRPTEGEFRDYVIWPPESRGVPLTFRVTVKARGAVAELAYPVTPQ